MKRRTKKTKRGGTLFFGIITAAVSYAFFILVFSAIAYFSADATKNLRLFSLIAIPLSGAVTGFLVTKKSEGQLNALISVTALSLILMLVGIITSKSAPGIGSFINVGIYVSSALLFSVLARRLGKRRKIRR